MHASVLGLQSSSSRPGVLPFEAAQVAFNAGVKAWEDTEECERLTAALLASAIPDKITKVIAFILKYVSGDNSRLHI